MDKITVKQAAKELGIPIGAIYGGLEQGKLPFGIAVQGKRMNYYISPGKFQAFLKEWKGATEK